MHLSKLIVSFLAGTFALAGAAIAGPEDNFPLNGLMPAGWSTTPGSKAAWAVASDSANGGTFSLKSGSMPDDPTAPSNSRRTAGIQVGGSFSAGTISFAYSVASEANADFFEFFIDGIQQLKASGTVPWTVASYPVSAGNHVFRWVYDKDASYSVPIDAAWIDTVVLPAGTLQQLLDVSTLGNGVGTVASVPSAIQCGVSCSGYFTTNSSVTLTAATRPGSLFSGWSGACAGTSTTCTVSMTSAKSATATFTLVDDGFPSGGAMPAGWADAPGSSISWKAATDATYRGPFSMRSGAAGDGQQSAVQFTSSVAAGNVDFAYKVSSEAFYDVFSFSIDGVTSVTGSGQVDWTKVSVPVSAGTHVFRFAYAKDASVGATNDGAWVDSFTLPPAAGTQRLTLTGVGVGAGTVTSSPAGINCGTTCSATFATNTVVTLTATPAAGSTFTSWSGACAGSATSCSVTMDMAKNVGATFWVPGAAGALDVDGSSPGSPYDALTDGVLLVRYLFGITGSGLTAGAVGATATRTDPAAITNYLNSIRNMLDIDGNGTVDALTDGLLIVRYLFGLHGTPLVSNVIGQNATRTTAAQIEPYLQSLTP